MIQTVLAVLSTGFVTGALARLVIPGPDPMPIWLTILIGLGGSLTGGVVAYVAFHRSTTAASLGGFVAAVLLVAAYRRFVQKRPLTGPDARKFPERGVGVAQMRERMQQLGLPLDRNLPVARPASPDTEDLLVKLNELHRAGVLTDDEYRAKRELVLERDEQA